MRSLQDPTSTSSTSSRRTIPPDAPPSPCWSCSGASTRSLSSRPSTSTAIHGACRRARRAASYNTAIIRAGDQSCRGGHHRGPPRSRSASCARNAATSRWSCFATIANGHGEYDIDNFEFHTHFEGAPGHSHNTEGPRRGADGAALGSAACAAHIEKLGLAARKVESWLPAGRCRPSATPWSTPIRASPHAPPECADILRRYLAPEPAVRTCCWSNRISAVGRAGKGLAGLCWPKLGANIGTGVIVDPGRPLFHR